MKLIKYLFLILLFYAFTGHAKEKSNIIDGNKVVAAIGNDYFITLKDLNQYIADWHYNLRFRVRSDVYRNALDKMIVDRLRVFDLFDRGLIENQDLLQKIRPILNEKLINAFFENKFLEKYANEETAARAYAEIEKEIICIDITLSIPEKSTKENLDSLKTIALKIEEGLAKNYDIEKLTKPYSPDNFKINTMRKVTWSVAMMDPVANVILKLQKGFTRVIESFDGFHIIKVLDIKINKLEPFEKMKDNIISQLQKAYYAASMNDYNNFRRGIVDKSSLKWTQSGLDQLVKWSAENDRFYAGAYKDTIQNAISSGNNFSILSYNNGSVDLKEYLRLLEEVAIFSPNTIIKPDNVKDFILDALYDDNIIVAAKKLGLEKKFLVPYTRDPIIADRLLYLFYQAVIEGGIPKATPEALYQFYEDNKDSTFYQLKIVYIYARIYSDSVKAAADINEIKKGTPFEKVSNAWSVNMYIRGRDGSLKAYKTSGGDYLAKAAFKLNLNESAGPIVYDDSAKGKQFAVIKCFKIQPEKQLTYEDVKGKRIEEEFANYYRKNILAEIDAKLKKKYHVEIFENVLSEAIASKQK